MKLQSMLLLCVAAYFGHIASLVSQTATTPKREFGIQISGINFDGFTSFSGIFKREMAENKYRRISGTFGNIQFESSDSYNFYLSAGISVGVEKRKPVSKKTTLYKAPTFSTAFALGKSKNIDPYWSFSPGVSWIFGLQYDFNESWAVNLEGGPGFSLTIRDFSGTDASVSIGGGFSSNVELALMHKF